MSRLKEKNSGEEKRVWLQEYFDKIPNTTVKKKATIFSSSFHNNKQTKLKSQTKLFFKNKKNSEKDCFHATYIHQQQTRRFKKKTENSF